MGPPFTIIIHIFICASNSPSSKVLEPAIILHNHSQIYIINQEVDLRSFKMVNFASTTIFGIAVLAFGVFGAPNQHSNKVITLEDIKNAQPVVPDVTDPTKKSLVGDSHDNSTLLQARPDLAQKVDQAKKTIPSLLADDKVPKPQGKMARRNLEKRAKVR